MPFIELVAVHCAAKDGTRAITRGFAGLASGKIYNYSDEKAMTPISNSVEGSCSAVVF